MKEILTKLLKEHEGCELQVYQCPAGFDTIGIGRNLETKGLSHEECDHLKLGLYDREDVIELLQVRGITQDEADYLLSNDIDFFTAQLEQTIDWFATLPETARIVLTDMAFNMGISGLLKFKKTLSLIETGQYIAASHEMLNSAWKFQVGKRAYDLSDMLRDCQT